MVDFVGGALVDVVCAWWQRKRRAEMRWEECEMDVIV
jgi:hypothetical protein